MRGCLWAQTNFLDFYFGLCLARFTILLRFFVKEFPVIKNTTNGRIGVWRNFDQVEIGFLGNVERFTDGNDANVLAIGTDETYFTRANVFVNSKF